MPRSKYQRPEVYLWVGKSGEKFWKAEWRAYIEGRPKPKHRAATWPCKQYTKTEAQQECDKLVREETDGYSRPDGSMTVTEFWDKVFWPIRSRKIAYNTKAAYLSSWTNHVKPALGKLELQHVTKHAIEMMLTKMADAGKGKVSITHAFVLMKAVLLEALENDYIAKNPARKVTLPVCKDPEETRALDIEECRKLLTESQGIDRLIWRVLLTCGPRIGELLALQKSDLVPAGLLIDESALEGKASHTKNRKKRLVPLPAGLRTELEAHARTVQSDLLFPGAYGAMMRRTGKWVQDLLGRGKSIIPDLTFRMCRTTLATRYEGEARDRQAILGHYSEEFTARVYQKPIPARQMAAIEALDAQLTGKVVMLPKREKAG